MSWLFDRLCSIAVADQIEVIVSSSRDGISRADASDWADVLVSSAAVPQTIISTLPAGAPLDVRLASESSAMDLCEVEASDRRHRIDALLGDCARRRRALIVRGDCVSVRGIAESGRPLDFDDGRVYVVAADRPSPDQLVDQVGRQGLTIGVGSTGSGAQVLVDSFGGLTAIVDALVALRTFAFGGADGRTALAPLSDERRFEPPLAVRRVL